MTHQIAVINFKESERTLLAKALSCVSGYPMVQNRTMYEWIRMFQIDANRINCWENQFLLMSSSFIKRVKSEFCFSDFISNGAVFTEALSLRFKIKEGAVVLNEPEEMAFLESLLNVTGRHAARHYDTVIHVRNTDSAGFDELSIGFYDQYRIAYKLYDGSSMKNMLESIVRDTEIPVVQFVESSIDEAERMVNFKTWKS